MENSAKITYFYDPFPATIVLIIFLQINIRAGGRVDSVQVIYAGHKGGVHGGQGGALHRLRLYQGDRIVRVTGRAGLGPGASLDQLTLHTKK